MKKNILFFTLFIVSFSLQSQNKEKPVLVINQTQKMDVDATFINKNRIESIDMGRNVNNEVHIELKTKKFTFLTLKDVLKKYSSIKEIDNSMIFKINGKIIEGIENVKIDDTYSIDVSVDNSLDDSTTESKKKKIISILLNSKS